MGQRSVRMLPLPVRLGGLGISKVEQEALLIGNGSALVGSLALPSDKNVLMASGGQWKAKPEGKILQTAVFSNSTGVSATGSLPIWTFGITPIRSGSRILLNLAMASGRNTLINAWGGYFLRRTSPGPVDVYRWGYPFCYFPSLPQCPLALGTVDGLYLDSPNVNAGVPVSYTVFLDNASGIGFLNWNWYGQASSTALLMEVA